MNKEQQTFQYRKEKRISITFEGESREFLLVALSAKKTENALIEAQDICKKNIKSLTDAGETLKDIFLLQDKEVIQEAFLETEIQSLQRKAAKTLVEDSEDFAERLQEKTEILMEKKREELEKVSQEELVEWLTRRTLATQIENMTQYINLSATLAQALCTLEGKPVFNSLEEMKSELSAEQIDELLTIWIDFMNKRGNAQVFPDPCTFKG